MIYKIFSIIYGLVDQLLPVYIPVVTGPYQNRACAINAHGSSYEHLQEFLLCTIVSFPPYSCFWAQVVFLYCTCSYVTSFPPAALPAFSGTIRLSDSLHLILPSSLFKLSGILSFYESRHRVSRVAVYS